jgi:hypothetical protein
VTQAGAFAIAVIAAICIARLYGPPSLCRTAWALAGNMLAIWAAQYASGSYTPWQAFLIIDVITAYIVLAHPAGRTQALIGAIYVAQIIAHVAFGAAKAASCGGLYMDLLAFGGVCQLLILATGAINGRRGKVAGARDDGMVPARAVAADLARVEKRP